jgi:hypothetical protein
MDARGHCLSSITNWVDSHLTIINQVAFVPKFEPFPEFFIELYWDGDTCTGILYLFSYPVIAKGDIASASVGLLR